MDDTGTSPAPKVTIAVKRRTPTETYVFANNFGADGKFHFFVNAPMANLAITDMLSGANMTWSAVRGCAVFEAPLPKCGYGVYRIASAPFDVEHLPVRAVQTAPPPVAAGPDSAANLPIGTTAVLTEAKTTNGAPLYWLSSPFIRAAVVPERGGRVAYLSGAGTDVNNVLTPTGVFPPEGIVSSDDGGIKAVLDVNGATYPGITLARTFAVTGRTSTPSQASVSMQDKVDNLQIDQTFSVSQSDPALRVNVRQHSMTAPRNLRLYLHGSLLLNGQVNRAVSFAAGNSKQSVSMPYEIGMQAGRPVGFPADWGAVVDTMQHTAILCVLNKGYSHVTFWNGMRDYNFEAGSEFADTSATNPEEGQASFYVCRDIPQINFVTHGLAGYFAAYPEAGGQSIAVSICGLTGKPEPLDLVIIGVKQATKEEQVLGSFSIIAKPVTGSQQNLSLGGSGSGYDAYRLCLKRDGSVIPLKEVAGNVNSNAPANSADSAVAAWRGDEISLLTTPLRMPAAMPWTLEQGTVRVKFKTNATHDIVHHGVYLVNGYHGAVDHHLNRTSRLWLNIDGLAVWSPSAPMIFLMIYDKEGRRIHVTANATLRDDSWYELAAVWDAKAKTAALYLDGHPLKISEQVFPDGWNGAEPIESFEVGDAGCEIGGGAVLPIATTLTNQE